MDKNRIFIMNMARIRHIMAMRKALKAPPLLPPKIKSRERSLGGDTDKRTGPKDIIDVNLQIRDLRTELGSSRIVVCLFSESECGRDGPWKLVATSDAVPKNATIDIPEIFAIEYAFERSQFIKLEICDFTEQNAVVLGYATFLVSEVVCNSGEFSRDVTNEETGEFVAHMSITFTTRRRSQPVLLQFCGKNLSKKGMFGEPQLQFHLSRIEDSGDRTVIYKSELLCYSLKIQWKQFTVQNSVIADVRSRQLVVECYSQDDRGKRVLVGEFITDLTQLQASTTAQNVFFVSLYIVHLTFTLFQYCIMLS
ncbi:unnamed protein product [Toxocara canis]|uniref:C2 domain-containing protein n=1 Tax=Toxocara canis TaxID=6265 RepID=A0A183VC06_TOXCA|nr:unnamed protein product [Toxocara canis]